MPESAEFWDFYWEMRLREMENLGKREAILAGSRLIRLMAEKQGRGARMLELGCGEAQIIGSLADAHSSIAGVADSVGIDYLHASVERSRRDYPRLKFIEGDFTSPALLEGLGPFDLVLLVNALHEVYSSTFSERLSEVDVPAAKARVAQALHSAAARLAAGGYLLLFDGLEPPGDPQAMLRVRFTNPDARAAFEIFAREYHPFHIHYRFAGGPGSVELSRRDFTRYIDKSIFLGKRLWQSERLESYQYYTEAEFRDAFSRCGLEILSLRTFTVNEEKWRAMVEIETPGEEFPQEHILIIARAGAPQAPAHTELETSQ